MAMMLIMILRFCIDFGGYVGNKNDVDNYVDRVVANVGDVDNGNDFDNGVHNDVNNSIDICSDSDVGDDVDVYVGNGFHVDI